MGTLDDQRELRAEIQRLRGLRTWLIGLIIFFVVCVPLLGYAFFCVESGQNSDMKSWVDGILFAVKQSTGADITQMRPVTTLGRVIAISLALIDALLFGFVASIIVLSVEVRSKSARLVRLAGA